MYNRQVSGTNGKGGLIGGKWLAKDTNLHTNDGYKLVECPSGVSYIINALMLKKQVVDITNSSEYWTIEIKPQNNFFAFRKRDLENSIEKGMMNLVFDNGKVFIHLEI